MIRVLHSVSNMHRAGIETLIMNYYRHMDRELVQFDFWCNKPQVGLYEEEISKLGGRVYRSTGYNPLKFSKYVNKMKQIPDINAIHVHNGALGLYALTSAKYCGIKTRIYHAHSSMIPIGRGQKFKSMIKPLIKYNANHLLTCSEKSGYFYYGKKRMDNGKCILLRNAIEVERFLYCSKTRDEIRNKYNWQDKTVIAHVGRFTEAKNHLRLLEIFSQIRKYLNNAILVLLGDGELENSVREKVKELNLTQYVHFMGNHADVNRWYQAFDLFLMPSIWEGLPVVAIEAQTASLPCIFSSAVTQEAQITDICKFIDLKENDDVWAKNIVEMIQNAPARINRQIEVQKAGYDVNIEAKKLQDMYIKWIK